MQGYHYYIKKSENLFEFQFEEFAESVWSIYLLQISSDICDRMHFQYLNLVIYIIETNGWAKKAGEK